MVQYTHRYTYNMILDANGKAYDAIPVKNGFFPRRAIFIRAAIDAYNKENNK